MGSTSVPNHIGIILDGNRRFAKRLMAKPWKGHEWGKEKVEKLLSWSKELGIQELTLYAFSIENFNRPKKEFDYLMDLFVDAFQNIMNDPKLNEIRINFVGRIHMFPDKVKTIMNDLMEKTKLNGPYLVNFAMAYGGQQEIIDATIKIAEKVKEGKLDITKINKELFLSELGVQNEPDLIIRTGGDKRMSNFLTFQSAYTEFIFLEKFWPEFEKKDLIDCVNEFSLRNRRFGR